METTAIFRVIEDKTFEIDGPGGRGMIVTVEAVGVHDFSKASAKLTSNECYKFARDAAVKRGLIDPSLSIRGTKNVVPTDGARAMLDGVENASRTFSKAFHFNSYT